MFSNLSILRLKTPFFNSFPEINLRMYVRCKLNDKWKTGVVFIKEISPSFFIGIIAKVLYYENFITRSMLSRHVVSEKDRTTCYAWKHGSKWNHIRLRSGLVPTIPEYDSLEAFVCNQYTAFTKRNNTRTCMFEIQHRPWMIYPSLDYDAEIEADGFKVDRLSGVFATRPATTFLMDGSITRVSRPRLLHKLF